MLWGDAVTKLKTFVWIFNHACFKSHNLIPAQTYSTKLGQILNMTFYMVVSVYRFVFIV